MHGRLAAQENRPPRGLRRVPSDLIMSGQCDLRRPSAARISNFLLGGKTNWAVDREFARRALDVFPLLARVAEANYLFIVRSVRYLAELGIRQFIDIGGGTPALEKTHQVVDKVVSDCRVVYVESDPIAVAHAEILLDHDGDPGRHAVVHANPARPEEVWEKSRTTGMIIQGEPVALLMASVTDNFQVWRGGHALVESAVFRYRQLLPSGSHLVISHITKDSVPNEMVDQLSALTNLHSSPHKEELTWRSRSELAALFGDFELVAPGIVWTTEWRAAVSRAFTCPGQSMMLAGVGRKVDRLKGAGA